MGEVGLDTYTYSLKLHGDHSIVLVPNYDFTYDEKYAMTTLTWVVQTLLATRILQLKPKETSGGILYLLEQYMFIAPEDKPIVTPCLYHAPKLL